MRRHVGLGACALLAAACFDSGPVAGPGRVTATLLSPNGAEGSAVVALVGDSVGETTPADGVDLYRSDRHGVTRLVIVSTEGGDLSFEVDVADTTHLPLTVVEQVAGPDDELRFDVSGYRLELRR